MKTTAQPTAKAAIPVNISCKKLSSLRITLNMIVAKSNIPEPKKANNPLFMSMFFILKFVYAKILIAYGYVVGVIFIEYPIPNNIIFYNCNNPAI